MKESFYASVCANGIHGGGMYLVDDGFYFRCQKATIADEYKNLRIPYENIKSIFAGKKVFFIPTRVIETSGGKTYCFLIFNRKRFMRCINTQRLPRAAVGNDI